MKHKNTIKGLPDIKERINRISEIPNGCMAFVDESNYFRIKHNSSVNTLNKFKHSKFLGEEFCFYNKYQLFSYITKNGRIHPLDFEVYSALMDMSKDELMMLAIKVKQMNIKVQEESMRNVTKWFGDNKNERKERA